MPQPSSLSWCEPELVMDIANWLRGLGLEQYEDAFRENAIDAGVLRELTADDLRELGITPIGHRRKLLAAIAALRAETAQPVAETAPAATATSSEAERRQLTVMFCDLVGSTPLSTRFDPEDLRDIVGAYHRCVADTVARSGGFVASGAAQGAARYRQRVGRGRRSDRRRCRAGARRDRGDAQPRRPAAGAGRTRHARRGRGHAAADRRPVRGRGFRATVARWLRHTAACLARHRRKQRRQPLRGIAIGGDAARRARRRAGALAAPLAAGEGRRGAGRADLGR